MDAHLSGPQKLWADWLCSWPQDPCDHTCIITKDFFLKQAKLKTEDKKQLYLAYETLNLPR